MRQVFGTPAARYLVPVVLLALVIGYVGMALAFTPGARTMPLLVGALLLLMVPIDLISLSHTKVGTELRQRINPAASEEPSYPGTTRQQYIALAWVVGFAVMTALAGILAAVPLYIAGSLRFLGHKSWRQALLTAALATVGIVGMFQVGLGVELYPGIFLARH